MPSLLYLSWLAFSEFLWSVVWCVSLTFKYLLAYLSPERFILPLILCLFSLLSGPRHICWLIPQVLSTLLCFIHSLSFIYFSLRNFYWFFFFFFFSRSVVITFWDPVDYSLPGSSAHGISKARILEWVAISFSFYWSLSSLILLLNSVKLICWIFSFKYCTFYFRMSICFFCKKSILLLRIYI